MRVGIDSPLPFVDPLERSVRHRLPARFAFELGTGWIGRQVQSFDPQSPKVELIPMSATVMRRTWTAIAPIVKVIDRFVDGRIQRHRRGAFGQ